MKIKVEQIESKEELVRFGNLLLPQEAIDLIERS